MEDGGWRMEDGINRASPERKLRDACRVDGRWRIATGGQRRGYVGVAVEQISNLLVGCRLTRKLMIKYGESPRKGARLGMTD